MEFGFATAGRILFGCGKIDQVGTMAAEIGNNALLITGQKYPAIEGVISALGKSNLDWHQHKISGEPTINSIEEAVDIARSGHCDYVIGFGGGSVIDAGKAVSALMTNPGAPLTYLEVVGEGRPLVEAPAPYIAIPTTAGTGSEVTRNAVLTVESKAVKVSLRSHMMLPTVAIIDPELTYSQPPELTATVGMDALTQVLEPFVSKRGNQMVDMFCKEGLMHASRSLEAAYHSGDESARVDMAWTSLLGGLALANSGLGAVHGFAGPLGGMYHAPHGALCATLLPVVTETNINVLTEREPGNPALRRYLAAARIVTGDDEAEMSQLVEWLVTLCKKLSIPPLRDLGIKREDFPVIIDKSRKSSSMKGNPIVLKPEELSAILQQAY